MWVSEVNSLLIELLTMVMFGAHVSIMLCYPCGLVIFESSFYIHGTPDILKLLSIKQQRKPR